MPRQSALVLAAIITFCSSVSALDWPVGRGDLAGTGATTEQLPAKLDLIWQVDIGGLGFEAAPIIAQGTVFVADADGLVLALDLVTGKEKWRLATGGGFTASGAYHSGKVIFGDIEGEVRALDATTGKSIWQYTIGAEISAGATFFGDNLLVTSQNGSLYCLNQDTGTLSWKYETGDQLRCAATVADNRTYLGGCDSKLHVVDLKTGKAAAEPIALFGPTGSTPSAIGSKVFVPTRSGEIFAFDNSSTKPLWQFADRKLAEELENSVAVKEGLVIVSSRNRQIFALDQETGLVRWRTTLRKRCDSSPIIAGKDIWLAAADGRLVRLDLNSGKEKWLYEIKGSFLASPSVADGKIVAASDRGSIFCFAAKPQ